LQNPAAFITAGFCFMALNCISFSPIIRPGSIVTIIGKRLCPYPKLASIGTRFIDACSKNIQLYFIPCVHNCLFGFSFIAPHLHRITSPILLKFTAFVRIVKASAGTMAPIL
jgi:hypothetical protein